ncbi:MAG TPA: hypothetical protein VJN71_09245 [Nitrososphaerales archaeon]|nr:hypothetical protein [Nitrososphaerales archaeon]
MEQRFDSILACIDKGFEVYGQNIASVVYWEFKQKYSMNKEDVLSKPELFKVLLQHMFGAGSKCIERAIVREIRQCFDLDLANFFDLTEAIRKAKDYISIISHEDLVLDVMNRPK